MNAGRWTIIVVILAFAGIVALWPQTVGGDPASSSGGPGVSRSAGTAESDALLAPLRQRADMRPWPSPSASAPPSAEASKDVTATCLGQVDLGASLAGKATLVNVWASWCQPCREEMPVLAEYAERSGAVAVLGVDVKEPASDGLAFMVDLGVNYPSVHDGTNSVQRALDVPPVLPVNYLVRPDGSVERISEPMVFHIADEVDAAVQRHLGVG